MSSQTFDAAAHEPIAERLAVSLAKHDFVYARGIKTSAAEWLYKAMHALRPYKKDIVAFAGKALTHGLASSVLLLDPTDWKYWQSFGVVLARLGRGDAGDVAKAMATTIRAQAEKSTET